MRKWLAAMLCMVLLLSLCACGGDAEYKRGMRLIDEGNYTEAYRALQASADSRAAAELAKFVCVPLRKEYKNITSGRETVDEYTYDDAGNLLTHRYNGNLYRSYTYDDHNRMVKLEDHTYSGVRETVRTYDKQGNLLSNKATDVGTENFEENTYTYDRKNRILTHRTHHLYYGEEYLLDRTYHYAADGTYYWEGVDPGDGRMRQYYDADGRELKFVQYNDAGEEIILNEYRYNEAGNVVYHAQFPDLEVSTIVTSVYNAFNKLAEQTTEIVGEGTEKSIYTYDDKGNYLTYTKTGLYSNESISYTYDEAGHLICKEQTGSSGSWRNYTYTYNADGTVKTVQRQGSDGLMLTSMGYDEWGNRTTMQRSAGSTEEQGTVTWQMGYYPDGVPEEVAELIEEPPFETWLR